MKSVLITGSNRGIGLGLVRALLSIRTPPGCIVATCRRPAEAKELQEVARENPNVHIVQLEVTDFASFPSLVENVKKLVGNDGLNVLINNAGTAGKFLKIGYLKPEAMMESYQVNTVAPVILTKEFIPLLKMAAERNSDQPLGSSRATVVNISSVLGSISDNTTGGFYPYRCSKTALNCATKSLSVDFKDHNILAVALHPGWVKTALGGPSAPMEVEDSCRSLVKTIGELGERHNGAFLNYDGKPLPW